MRHPKHKDPLFRGRLVKGDYWYSNCEGMEFDFHWKGGPVGSSFPSLADTESNRERIIELSKTDMKIKKIMDTEVKEGYDLPPIHYGVIKTHIDVLFYYHEIDGDNTDFLGLLRGDGSEQFSK